MNDLIVRSTAGLTTTGLEIAGVSVPLVNLSVMVSAVSSARFVKVATPPDAVALVAPERAGAAAQRGRDLRAVVARLQVAVLVLFIDDRLGGEGLPGRGRRRGLGVDDQLAGRRRADDDRCSRSPRSGRRSVNWSVMRLGLVVGQVRERGHAARDA